MVNAELDCIRTGKSGCLADRQFAREILLELPRGSHTVIAEPNCDWRGFLPNLKRSVASFNQIRNAVVYPRIRNSVDGRSNRVGRSVHVWRWHRGKTRNDGAHRP